MLAITAKRFRPRVLQQWQKIVFGADFRLRFVRQRTQRGVDFPYRHGSAFGISFRGFAVSSKNKPAAQTAIVSAPASGKAKKNKGTFARVRASLMAGTALMSSTLVGAVPALTPATVIAAAVIAPATFLGSQPARANGGNGGGSGYNYVGVYGGGG